jgi:hypothetical protein
MAPALGFVGLLNKKARLRDCREATMPRSGSLGQRGHMRRLCIPLVFLFCAMSAAQAFKGECVLQVKGKSYLNGPCDITIDANGSFQVSTRTGRLYFAHVLVESDGSATASWNGTIPGATHAHTDLGALTKQDGCWVNDQAKICAWPPGKRKH